MSERTFQSKLIKEIKTELPGCMVIEPDPSTCKGIPDVLILYNDKWASLECKISEKAYKQSLKKQPSQGYFVDKMNGMSFSRFIFPENKEEVMNELYKTFRS